MSGRDLHTPPASSDDLKDACVREEGSAVLDSDVSRSAPSSLTQTCANCGHSAHLHDTPGGSWCAIQGCGCPQFHEAMERWHAIRWRWRYYVQWRLIGRKGPL